jgi:LmbE family N-acetylglucosaminyl deacetylase
MNEKDPSKSKIMTIFAHQDDETFSAGGVLSKYGVFGNSFAVSVTSDPKRKDEFDMACKILKTHPIKLDFSDVTPSNIISIKSKLKEIILEFRPNIIITHLDYDYHYEHRMVRTAVEDAVEWASHTTNPEMKAHQVDSLWETETTILIPFPEYHIDITEVFNKKLEAIKIYESQSHKGGENFYSKFHSTRTRLRGIQAGVKHAEVFNMVNIAKTGSFKPQNHLKYFP